jgi:hypothetical protein
MTLAVNANFRRPRLGPNKLTAQGERDWVAASTKLCAVTGAMKMNEKRKARVNLRFMVKVVTIDCTADAFLSQNRRHDEEV